MMFLMRQLLLQTTRSILVSKNVCYFIYGDNEKYKAELDHSISTLRKHEPRINVTVIKDKDTTYQNDSVNLIYETDLDVRRENMWWPKIQAIIKAPFGDADQVIFLDTDTEVQRPLNDFFDLLSAGLCDIAAAIGGNSTCNGIPGLKDRCLPEQPYYNTGTLIANYGVLKHLYLRCEQYVNSVAENEPTFADEYAFNMFCLEYHFLALAPSQQARRWQDYRTKGPGVTTIWHSRFKKLGDFEEQLYTQFLDWLSLKLPRKLRGIEIDCREGAVSSWLMRNAQVEQLYCLAIDPIDTEVQSWRYHLQNYNQKVQLLVGNEDDFYRLLKRREPYNFILQRDGNSDPTCFIKDPKVFEFEDWTLYTN